MGEVGSVEKNLAFYGVDLKIKLQIKVFILLVVCFKKGNS